MSPSSNYPGLTAKTLPFAQMAWKRVVMQLLWGDISLYGVSYGKRLLYYGEKGGQYSASLAVTNVTNFTITFLCKNADREKLSPPPDSRDWHWSVRYTNHSNLPTISMKSNRGCPYVMLCSENTWRGCVMSCQDSSMSEYCTVKASFGEGFTDDGPLLAQKKITLKLSTVEVCFSRCIPTVKRDSTNNITQHGFGKMHNTALTHWVRTCIICTKRPVQYSKKHNISSPFWHSRAQTAFSQTLLPAS